MKRHHKRRRLYAHDVGVLHLAPPGRVMMPLAACRAINKIQTRAENSDASGGAKRCMALRRDIQRRHLGISISVWRENQNK